MPNIAISVDKVSKNFKLPHHATSSSIKSLFINPLSVKKNCKNETQVALKDVSFEIKQGEFFGIVGRNGSGKSTLLKIIAGIYQPNEGSVSVSGKLVPFIELGVGFNPELTGRENIYLSGALMGFTDKEIDKKYSRIIEFSELERFIDQKLKNYSSGMQVRLAFSVATILAESDILLVDEVLAVGDADFQRKCYEFFSELKQKKKTVIFVTHDMNAVREYCDRAVMVEKSKIIKSGTGTVIAKEYIKLFNKDSTKIKNGSMRWGDRTVSVEVDNKKIRISKKDTSFEICARINCKSDYDEVVVGFMISNSKGVAQIGTNTKVEDVRICNVKNGSKYAVKWTVPNILSDDTFYVDIAATGSDGVSIYDWRERVVEIVSNRDYHTPYSIAPDIKTKISPI